MDPIPNAAGTKPAQSSPAAPQPAGVDPAALEAASAAPPATLAAAPAGWVVSRWRKSLVQSLGVGLCYAIVLVFFSLKLDNFVTTANVETILDGATLLGIVAVGQTFLIVGGGFDLSVGGVVPLGAVVFGTTVGRLGLVPAMLVTVVVGAGVGLVTGLIVVYGKINPLITTLGMLSIAGGAAYIVVDGQTNELTSSAAGFWGNSAPLGLQTGTWAFIGLAIVGGLVLKFSVYGRSVYTIGGNREAAELAGLRVNAIAISTYVLTAACAAFGGAISASQLLASAPDIGTDTTLNSIAAVVLGGAALTGGVGGMSGTILGVLLLGTIADGLALLQVASFYQTVITGAVLLVAVGFSRARDVLALSSFVRRRI
jgi:ribose transport system permease protein